MSRKVIRRRKAAAARAYDAAIARSSGCRAGKSLLSDELRRMLTADEVEQLAKRLGVAD